jgi:hypothetical protein
MSNIGKAFLWLAVALAVLWIATHWQEVRSHLRGLGMMPTIEERLHAWRF